MDRAHPDRPLTPNPQPPNPLPLTDRLLALVELPDSPRQAAIARAFQLFLFTHVAVRTLLWAQRADDWVVGRYLLAAVLVACAVVVWRLPARAHAAAAVALAALTIKLGASFPGTSNHFFLEYLCVALCVLCAPADAGERTLLLAAVRGLTLIVLFHSGLQKVLHATYFDAQFLGYEIGSKSAFAWLFGWLLPADELARLRALHPTALGNGPYAVRSVPVVLLANAIWAFEMLAPVFLVWRRTRVPAVFATIAVIVLIQAGARELMFGVLMINLLLLFLPTAVNSATLPGFLMLFAVLVAARAGLLPRFFFN